MLFVSFLLQKVSQTLARGGFGSNHRIPTYPAGVCLEYILHILRLNIRFYRVIIVTDDFTHVTIAYILLEFVIRYVFRTCTIFVGQVQAQKHHGYDHIQPVQVELGHIDLIGLFVSVIIIVHRAY